MTTTQNIPAVGRTVVFDVPPLGSHAAAGTRYRVVKTPHRDSDIWLARIDQPHRSTYDRPSAYRRAQWRYAD